MSGLSLWQQSLTGMLIAYLSCAVSGSWASLSGLTLAAHKAFLTLILDDFEYDLAATALRTMRNGSSGIVPLGGGRRGYLLFIVEAFSVDPDLRVRRFRRSSGRPAGLGHDLLRDQHLLDVRLRRDPYIIMGSMIASRSRAPDLRSSASRTVRVPDDFAIRIPDRDDRLPLLALAGLVNNHPQVTFHLSSETPSRIVEHTAPGAAALVANNDDRAELVAARDKLQEEDWAFHQRLRLADERRTFGTLALEKRIRIREH